MNIQPSRFFAVAAFACAVLLQPPAAADEAKEASDIRTLIGAAYDKPKARVQTDPVAIVGDYAVADWIQGKRGGRALIRRNKDDRWEIALCAGRGLKQQATLEQSGIPSGTAKALLEKLAQAEKDIPAARRHKFDLFRDKGDMK